MRLAACCVALVLGLLLLRVSGANPEAGAGAVVVLGERQPPALSSGLGIDILGIPTGNGAPALPGPDIDANRYGPGVLVGFGQVVYDQVDMQIQGRDEVTTLVIARRHLSRRNQEHSIFGPAWAFNYRHTITRDTNSNVVVESFGRKDLFVSVPGSSPQAWEGTEGRFDRLIYNDNDSKYILRMPHGTILEFAADDAASNKSAHLTKITSPNGNTLVFDYLPRDTTKPLLERRLDSITDSFGRPIKFIYGVDGNSQWVTKIQEFPKPDESFSGRELVYSYTADGQLLSVRSPTVTSTGGLNNFPQGKTYQYSYHKELNALTSVVFPNQAAETDEAKKLKRFQWAYYDTNPQDLRFGYLKEFTLGSPSASEALKAGGTYFYAYKTSGKKEVDLNVPAIEVTVTDRRGTKTNYRVNRLGQVLSEAISNTGLRPNENIPLPDDGLPFPYEPSLPESFTKSFKYNSDGQLTNRFEPLGGKTDYVYGNRRDLEYNKNRKIPRNSEFNLTSTVRFPDSERKAQQKQIKKVVVYEPIFNQPFKVVNPRGFDKEEKRVVSETDKSLTNRFTTTYFYDYMGSLDRAKADFAPLLGLEPEELEFLFGRADLRNSIFNLKVGEAPNDQRAGNVIKIIYPVVLRPKSADGGNLASRVGLSEDVERAEELFRYNQFGQVVYHRDAEENVTTTTYYDATDPHGTNIQNGSETGGGYLRSIVRDAEALAGRNSGYKPNGQNPAPALKESNIFEYTAQGEGFPANPRGVPTAVTDPRGIKTKFLVNESDQVIKMVNAASVPASAGLTAFAYESITLYDHNDNVVETRIQNKDTLVENDPELIVNSYSYDILDQKTSETLDAAKLGIKNTFTYDPSQNLSRQVRGANKPANAPDHATEEFAYDERDLLLATTHGVEEGDKKAVFKSNVNADGDVTKDIDADDADVTPEMSAGQKTAVDAADGALGGDPTHIKYDGFGRAIERIDRAGNRTVYEYDSVSNIRSIQSFGPVDEASGKILLAKEETQYDERNRPYRTDRYIFQYKGKEVGTIDDGALDKGDGKVSSITLYDRLGRVVGEIDANDNTYQTCYDGLSRVIKTIDPFKNEVENTYDKNGNLTEVKETERSLLNSYIEASRSNRNLEPSSLSPDEVFTTTYTYDALNRQSSIVEPNTQTTRFEYDSRDNKIKTIDALGNETKMVYDNLDRLVETISYLSSDGLNASKSINNGSIHLRQEWDSLNRLVAQIDDNGNRTTYSYDDFDRRVNTTYADGTFETSEFNRDSDLVKHISQNGWIEDYSYDSESRCKDLKITFPDGITPVGTTRKTWKYDGLNRVIFAADYKAQKPDDDVICTYIYDSLSHQLRETQKIGSLPELVVDSEWQSDDRKVSITYPNGRKVKRSYDALNRLFEIFEAADEKLVSRFEYIGTDRDLRITYGNNTVLDKRGSSSVTSRTTSGTNPGYDSNRRNVWHRWKKKGEQSAIVGYFNTYNGSNRRISEKREHLNNHTDSYTFDSKYRMTGFRRNGTEIGDGGTVSQRILNGADKMKSLNEGSSTIAINLGSSGNYAKLNQYEAFAGKKRIYDKNFNLSSDGSLNYIHDFDNRIIEIQRFDGNSTVARYIYDANNRRVLKDVGNVKTRYLYDGWKVVEERGNHNAILRQYIDGCDIDEHLQLKDGTTGKVYYYHSNSQGSIGALTDEAGKVVELYEYSWLGKPTIIDADNVSQSLSSSKVGNSYFFQGRQLDAETAVQISDELDSPGLYYYRNRYYSSVTGEFLTIDPLGYWNHGQGNGFSAFCEDGWNVLDPLGEGPKAKKGPHPAVKKQKRVVIKPDEWDAEHKVYEKSNTSAKVVFVAEAKRKGKNVKNHGRMESEFEKNAGKKRIVRMTSRRTPEDVDRGTEVTDKMRIETGTKNTSYDVGHGGGGAKLGTPAHRIEFVFAQLAKVNRGIYSARTERLMRRWVKQGDYADSVMDLVYANLSSKFPKSYSVRIWPVNPTTGKRLGTGIHHNYQN